MATPGVSSGTTPTEPGQAPRHPRLVWRQTVVAAAQLENPNARTLRLDVPGWSGHRAGQHVDVRLTAPDGYQATRSYSLSSGPHEPPQITVQRTDEGEVSPFLVDVVEIGDALEVLGPLGGYFVWDPTPEPLLLVGGGSGIAPLRSLWRAAPAQPDVAILYSSRAREDVLFEDELRMWGPSVRLHLTREAADGFVQGRLDRASLEEALRAHERQPDVFVCGPTSFVEAMASWLTDLVDDPRRIRTERFG